MNGAPALKQQKLTDSVYAIMSERKVLLGGGMTFEQVTNDVHSEPATQVWRPSVTLIVLAGLMLVLSLVPFMNGLHLMMGWWLDRPEYSHGILMPVLAIFLIWQQRDELERLPVISNWWGVALTVVALFTLLLGKLGSVLVIVQYAYVLTLGGLTLSLVGREFARRLLVPFFILILMVPLPEFLFQNLTADLQLLSSRIGVAFIRLCGVSVYLEGNVIDLGAYKLQVAEACSGLRYLFPLMTLGFIMAHFFKAAWWKRAVVFLSSIPVTILMNSLRIGAIGLLVDRWGQSMAEGFLHDFEGWLIFMASGSVLLLEIILLSRIGSDRRPWREIFAVELPASTPVSVPRMLWQPTPAFVVSSVLVGLLAAASLFMPERTEQVPARQSFAEFPLQMDEWRGQRTTLGAEFLDALQLDDYILANFVDQGSQGAHHTINFYSAWYNSQKGGESSHSPRTCIPGGGWQLTSLDQVTIPDARVGTVPLRINRVMIEKGASKQLVYYWFQQRGRVITNEYMVKWYLFWDALTRQRTDGALVRFVITVPDGQPVAEVEQVLQGFVRTLAPRLDAFVPG